MIGGTSLRGNLIIDIRAPKDGLAEQWAFYEQLSSLLELSFRLIRTAGHASSGSGHAAENIAYGYDSFTKTLDQWINSSGHRKNLLMQGASRVGVASAKSSTTGRTYWALVIAGDYDKPKRAAAKATSKVKSRGSAAQPCRLSIMGLCF